MIIVNKTIILTANIKETILQIIKEMLFLEFYSD